MRIGLLSDTHGYLDEAIIHYFEKCDEIWHAGDLGSVDVLTRLQQFRTTRAVFGNIDGAEVRNATEAALHWTCEGLSVYMTHIGGRPGRYEPAARKQLQQLRPGLFICGHSHILSVMRDDALNLLHLNPGAAGNHGWHKTRTALRFTISGGKLSAVEAIDLGPRGKRP